MRWDAPLGRALECNGGGGNATINRMYGPQNRNTYDKLTEIAIVDLWDVSAVER